ncbi:hypothetical protein D3870_00470 [Noviherbaspirillum cavernae]|uniref:Uncharacterized protein n=1 Tax=Noviherbaspirillum cavernae TaxID=2320862 RepID=A0A418WWS4_9BURK|nr:hypothetical protein D3870_00470 [Noviherbaspirillum cavernae]
MTPKDVTADEATAQDVMERNLSSADADQRMEDLLDDSVEATFPASDPIAITLPHRKRPAKGPLKPQKY